MEEEQVTTARITVGEIAYELPALDTISIGESKIIKRHSGMTLDQLFELEGLDGGAIGGLLAVAMKRLEPSLSDRELDIRVDAVNMFAIMEEFAASVEEVNPTQDEAPPPEDESSRSKLEPIASSGSNGSDDSEPSPERSSLVSTGLHISDSSAISDPKTLEV